jgi:hypothetical protein
LAAPVPSGARGRGARIPHCPDFIIQLGSFCAFLVTDLNRIDESQSIPHCRFCIDILYDFKYDLIEDMHMNERVTVTLPEEIVRDIDRRERNRSRFVLQAVQHELKRRQKEELRRSLRTPHQDSDDIAQAGFAEWAEGLPEGDEDLIDIQSGENVRWVPGKGWIKEE